MKINLTRISIFLGAIFLLPLITGADDHVCVHDLWLLSSSTTQSTNYNGEVSDAATLRVAAAEFIFENKDNLNQIKDQRATELFKSIAAGKPADPTAITESSVYYTLFKSLKSKSKIADRLVSEQAFLFQCRQRLVSADEVIWNLPSNVEDLFGEKKPIRDLFSRVGEFVKRKPAKLADLQHLINNVATDKRLPFLTKALKHGLEPITIGEAIRMIHVFGNADRVGATQALLPFIFNDLSFYSAMDSFAMLTTFNADIAAIFLNKFDMHADLKFFEEVLKISNTDITEKLINRMPFLRLNFKAAELIEKIKTLPENTGALDLKLYFKLAKLRLGETEAQTQLKEFAESHKLDEKQAKALSQNIKFTVEGRGSLAALEGLKDYDLILSEEAIEKSGASDEVKEFVRGMTLIDDPQIKFTQIPEFIKKHPAISDEDFILLYDSIPKGTTWAFLGAGCWTNAEDEFHKTYTFTDNFRAPVEVVAAMNLLRHVKTIKNVDSMTANFNRVFKNTRTVLKNFSFPDSEKAGASQTTYNDKFIGSVMAVLNNEFTRILDPEQTPRE